MQPCAFIYVSLWLLYTTTAETKSCKKLYGPQNLEFLLSGPSQKKFANSCTKILEVYCLIYIIKVPMGWKTSEFILNINIF